MNSQAKALLNQCPEVTAVVTFNDVMAAGLMASLQEQGIQIPKDISIIGFDDILLARYIYPRLTTLHNPIDEMSNFAAKLALKLKNKNDILPRNHCFYATLV